ncbi:MAG: response regulator [Candidatus Omnitrophica bacterium]|nr:response regulator [Candidatus Omnitrophota bacterium]
MAYQILLVDDDDEFREEMRICLEQYRVIEAVNGQEALNIIKKPHAVDVVILDVVLPDLSGTEVLKRMREMAPDLSIIILTGQSSKDVAVDALKGHADDYIEKPFNVEKFLATIQKVLETKNQTPTAHVNKMERVKTFIERNFDKKINLKHAADQVCLSSKYLSRLFKKTTGSGFNDYRLKIKIQKATGLLRTTDCTVDQLANQLGYKNPESFIRMFEKLMGKTPTQYRLKHKGRIKKNHERP